MDEKSFCHVGMMMISGPCWCEHNNLLTLRSYSHINQQNLPIEYLIMDCAVESGAAMGRWMHS